MQSSNVLTRGIIMELIKQLAEIQQKLKVKKGRENTFGGYWYRNLEDIMEAVKPLLNGLVLTFSDEVREIGGHLYIASTAKLSDGENEILTTGYARETMEKKKYDSSQLTGSASTYARKYAANGLFCLDDTKDSDTTNIGNVKPAPELPSPLYEVYEYALKKYNEGDLQGVGDCFEGFELKEEQVAVWNMFNSKQRAAIKKFTKSDEYVKKEIKKERFLNDFQHAKFIKDFNIN